MDAEYWKSRWKEGRIGFHEGRPNQFLEQHADKLPPNARVLVPLCGKAEDMAWLAAREHPVVGVDVAEPAVRAFFNEHGLETRESHDQGFTRLEHGPLTLLAGDFFATTRELLGNVDAFYDRAALVALPEPMRKTYVRKLRTLFSPGAHGILITFEYPQDTMQGPPFSVPQAEVESLFAGARIELLGEGPADFVRFRDAGIEALERCFLVTL